MGECVKFAVAAALSAMAAGAAALSAMAAGAAAAPERTQVGQRTCGISGGIGLVFGSRRTLNFTPSEGLAEFYAGTLTEPGVDIGVTDRGAMVWLVYAPTSRPAGALAGSYGGATAEATVGAGVGADVLVAATNRTIALQPVSPQGQSGLNVAAGVAGIDLRGVR
jgi:hypothetical protein